MEKPHFSFLLLLLRLDYKLYNYTTNARQLCGGAEYNAPEAGRKKSMADDAGGILQLLVVQTGNRMDGRDMNGSKFFFSFLSAGKKKEKFRSSGFFTAETTYLSIAVCIELQNRSMRIEK